MRSICIGLITALATHTLAQPAPQQSVTSESSAVFPSPPATTPITAKSELPTTSKTQTPAPLPDKFRASVLPVINHDEWSKFLTDLKNANAQWSDRFTEIATLLEKTGVTLKATDKPGVWIITSPLTATIQPTISVRLLPAYATPDQMEYLRRRSGVPLYINQRLRCSYELSTHPDGLIAGTGDGTDDTLFLLRDLLEQTYAALDSLPEIKPLNYPAPIADTPRTQKLRALLKDLKATRTEARSRWETLLINRENFTNAEHHRASTWEQFNGSLDEVIADTEKELKGQLPPPHAAEK